MMWISVALLLRVASAHGGHGLLASPVNLGFDPIPLNQSYYRVPLSVRGEIPKHLRGTLYRGAPGAWPDGWWLDGLITLNAFKFEDGNVFYSMQWNKDEAYNHTVTRTPPAEPLAKPPVPGAILHFANSSFPTGVAFHEVDGKLVSTTGVSNANSFDPETLLPQELPFVYNDELGAPFLAPTHTPVVDGYVLHHLATGVLKNSGGMLGYIVTSIKPGTRTRDVIARIEKPTESSLSGKPSFQHQTLATSEYYIMIESNCYYPDTITNVGQVDWAGWQSNLLEKAHVRVVNRANGKSLIYPLSYNVFGIHSINAYRNESTNSLIVDTIQLFPSHIPCSMAFRGTAMNMLKSGLAGLGYGMARPIRLVLPLDKPGAVVEPISISKTTGVEFPTIREQDHYGKPYKYFYGDWISKTLAPFYDSIIKVSTDDGSYIYWHVDGHYPGEPIFVPDPTGTAEDDGVVITNVLDSLKKESYLLVLDAKTMKEVARAGPTPHVIPHGYHGKYFDKAPEVAASTSVLV